MAKQKPYTYCPHGNRVEWSCSICIVEEAGVDEKKIKVKEYGVNKIREFDTGATRDSEEGKLDYEGFLSPAVLRRYAEYMNKCRVQSDGKLRESDNWQKGIPIDVYMKSMFRHFMEVWSIHRGVTEGDIKEVLCALNFNVMGYLHELMKKPTRKKPRSIVCEYCGEVIEGVLNHNCSGPDYKGE